MSLDIYNEGRVVGYSAYETYIKQFLSENPTGTPATEREWLSSMLTSGASLMLRIDADTDDSLHIRDIALPTDSKLRAANFIMANYTNVEVASADRDYPTKVASYSDNLVPNSTSNHPTSGYHTADTLPTATNPSEQIDTEAIKNYFKIKDGVVLQDGTWSDNTTTAQPPRMGFTPDMTKTPIVRLLIDGRITQPFYILLTGFTDVTVLEGTTGIQDSQLTHAPENGDYLGPATFPWAGKIIFGISSQIAEQYFSDKKITRKLPSTSATAKNVTGGIIDYADADLNWYDTYRNDTYSGGKYKDSTVEEDVTDENVDDGVGVLTAYSRFDGAPPAIYGSVVDEIGNKKLAPLDVITPGTVKVFDNKAELEAYLNNTPYVYAFFKDTSSGEPVLQFATKVEEGTYQYTTLGGEIGIVQADIHGAKVWVVDLGDNQYGLALTNDTGTAFPNPFVANDNYYPVSTTATAQVADATNRSGKGRLYWFDIFKCIRTDKDGIPKTGGTHAGWVDVWGDILRGLNEYVNFAGLVKNVSPERYEIQLKDFVSLRIGTDAAGWSLHTTGPAEFATNPNLKSPYIKIGTKRLFLSKPEDGKASNDDIGIWGEE